MFPSLRCRSIFFTLDASSRLKEEHIRTRERAAVVKEDEETEPTVEVPISDDEGSTIRGPTKANNSCGACRTRESDTWWRAPKGLATNILCETCGTNWRKYADLNVRPIREEILLPGKKSAEKREGTPLSAPSAKRLRVWPFVERFRWIDFPSLTDLYFNNERHLSTRDTRCTSATLSGVPKEWTHGSSPQVQPMSFPSTCG